MSMKMGLRKLKSRRVLLGLTQVDVAKKLGMTEKSYNLKENGKMGFSLKQVVQISEILEFSLEDVNEAFLHIRKS